jgi:hypothetical protein
MAGNLKGRVKWINPGGRRCPQTVSSKENMYWMSIDSWILNTQDLET